MELGFIGLGRMGKNMVFRLLDGKHRIVAWDRSPEPMREVEGKGATVAPSPSALLAASSAATENLLFGRAMPIRVEALKAFSCPSTRSASRPASRTA